MNKYICFRCGKEFESKNKQSFCHDCLVKLHGISKLRDIFDAWYEDRECKFILTPEQRRECREVYICYITNKPKYFTDIEVKQVIDYCGFPLEHDDNGYKIKGEWDVS